MVWRQRSSVIYTDYEKAFDKVSNELLLVKLEKYGLADNADSYVAAQEQQVVVSLDTPSTPSTSSIPFTPTYISFSPPCRFFLCEGPNFYQYRQNRSCKVESTHIDRKVSVEHVTH